MKTMTYKLILLRHGHSEWNAKNLFTGWVDVNLTPKGEAEAVRGGELPAHSRHPPEEAHGGGDTRPAWRQAAGNALADQVADGESGGKLAREQGANAKPPAGGDS